MTAGAARRVRLSPDPELDGLELWRLSPATVRASRPLLRELLAERLGERPEAIEFARQPCPVCGAPRGRPVLSRPASRLHFSLARGGELTLVALAREPVGVDVEPVSDAATAGEVTPLLHPAERRLLGRLPAGQRAAAFTRLWVRKEAYLKALGCGIAHGLDREALHDRAPAGWSIVDVPVGGGHVAALALSRAG